MSDRRIKLTRIGILMLIGTAASCLVIFVVIPSYLLASAAATISAAVHGAKSVTFSEFIPYLDTAANEVTQREQILHSIEASPEQVFRFLTATGGYFGFGSPLSHARCFDPHHRVDIVKRDGTRFRLEFCFLCGNSRFDDNVIHSMPAGWTPRLTRFFTDLGMPPRTSADYAKLVSDMHMQ